MKTLNQFILEYIPANAMSKPKKPKKKQDRPDPGYTYNADDLGIGLPAPKKQRNTRKGGHSYSANDL
jgi:hypothetical protein